MNLARAIVIRLFPVRSTRSGQAMLEYVIAAGIVLTMIVMLSFLLYALKQNGNRVLDLVASEYP